MRVFRLGLGALFCAAVTMPALAQMPGYPPPGPDFSCLCLKQSVDDSHTDMRTKQGELSTAQTQLGQLDNQLAGARSRVDVNNPQAVAQFRQMLAQRDTLFRQTNGDLITAAQAATANYNQAVAAYNNQCAGRPLPPLPPGPLSCPGVR
jgi:hypothetical protein